MGNLISDMLYTFRVTRIPQKTGETASVFLMNLKIPCVQLLSSSDVDTSINFIELFSHVFSPPKTKKVINQKFEPESYHVYAQPLLNLS